jgi:hypothetical protein
MVIRIDRVDTLVATKVGRNPSLDLYLLRTIRNRTKFKRCWTRSIRLICSFSVCSKLHVSKTDRFVILNANLILYCDYKDCSETIDGR